MTELSPGIPGGMNPVIDRDNWLIRRLKAICRSPHEIVTVYKSKAYRLDSQDLPLGAGLAYLRMLIQETKTEFASAQMAAAVQAEKEEQSDRETTQAEAESLY